MSSHNDLLKALENWAGIYLSKSLSEFFIFLKYAEISMLQAHALTYVFYNGPSKITDLCEAMQVSPAAASQMVDRLEKRQLVERLADPEDRRIRNVKLTHDGKAFVTQSIQARQHWLEELPGSLSTPQQEQIRAAIELLISTSQQKVN
jgi:DNA-binding MarR family transcriptional regulator